MKKIERMMGIILALNRKKKLMGQELADLFEVNVRTIYRDIQALSEIGVPIIALPGNDGGYSLLDEYFIPPVIFDRDEVLALLLSEKIINEVNIPGYMDNINTAFLKIKNIVCRGLQMELEKIESRMLFDFRNIYPDIVNKDFFNILSKSFEENKKIKIIYNDKLSKDINEYIIQPYGLTFNHGSWDIIALNEEEDEERIFRVDRIMSFKLLDITFEMPEGFCIHDYYNCKYYSNEVSSRDVQEIKIKATESVYEQVKDYVYFKDGKVLKDGDYYIINILTTRPNEYVWIGMNYIDGMEIIQPEWIREKIKFQTIKLQNVYK